MQYWQRHTWGLRIWRQRAAALQLAQLESVYMPLLWPNEPKCCLTACFLKKKHKSLTVGSKNTKIYRDSNRAALWLRFEHVCLSMACYDAPLLISPGVSARRRNTRELVHSHAVCWCLFTADIGIDGRGGVVREHSKSGRQLPGYQSVSMSGDMF